MSSFVCEQCDAFCIDSPLGYICGCQHHPPELTGLTSAQQDIIEYARSRGAFIPIPPPYKDGEPNQQLSSAGEL